MSDPVNIEDAKALKRTGAAQYVAPKMLHRSRRRLLSHEATCLSRGHVGVRCGGRLVRLVVAAG